MYALYSPSEDEYVGVEITHDDCNVPHDILTPYSQLGSDEPYLFVAHSREKAQALLEIARNHYQGSVPVGASVSDFDCEIENLADYVVVKIGIIKS